MSQSGGSFSKLGGPQAKNLKKMVSLKNGSVLATKQAYS